MSEIFFQLSDKHILIVKGNLFENFQRQFYLPQWTSRNEENRCNNIVVSFSKEFVTRKLISFKRKRNMVISGDRSMSRVTISQVSKKKKNVQNPVIDPITLINCHLMLLIKRS